MKYFDICLCDGSNGVNISPIIRAAFEKRRNRWINLDTVALKAEKNSNEGWVRFVSVDDPNDTFTVPLSHLDYPDWKIQIRSDLTILLRGE